MKTKSYVMIYMLFCLCFTHCLDKSPSDYLKKYGEFNLLTFNVAGLPQGISISNPEKNMPLISPLLNKFEIALVQEDYYYHDVLKSRTRHPYQTESNNGPSPFDFGDGLNRFSIFPFTTLYREAWQVCSNNNGNDCLARKGFSVAETEIAPGVVIDIYNLHLDSGGTRKDYEARISQVQQLLRAIHTRSAEKAVIITGDINLNLLTRPDDRVLFQYLLDNANLSDVCHTLSCSKELVDKVLFRSSNSLTIEAIAWQIDPDFVDEQGQPLSDHEAVSVKLRWRKQ